MKQIIVLGLVAFVFAIGGATWFAAFLLPPRPAADSTAMHKAFAFVATPTAAPASIPAPDSVRPKRTDSTPGQAPAAKVAAKPVDSSAAVTPGSAKNMGKILSSMKPAQAAKILAGLPNDQVEAILRQMNPKQVAPLLAALPNDRAAALSRALLTAPRPEAAPR